MSLTIPDFTKTNELYIVKTLNGSYIKGKMAQVHGLCCYLTEVEFYLQDPVSKKVLCEKTETAVVPLSAIVSIAPPGKLVELTAPVGQQGQLESQPAQVADESVQSSQTETLVVTDSSSQ